MLNWHYAAPHLRTRCLALTLHIDAAHLLAVRAYFALVDCDLTTMGITDPVQPHLMKPMRGRLSVPERATKLGKECDMCTRMSAQLQ
jgi:hypothetical protein